MEAGNPDLKPVRSWDTEVGLEHRLAGGGGVLSGTLFYRDVQDARGRVTFDGLISKISNIGGGEEYGFDGEISLDFTRLNWWDGTFTASYLRRHTEVTDPFDNVTRPFGFTPNWEAKVEYRHEIDTIIDGNISIMYSQTGARFINDIDKVDRLKSEPSLTINLLHRVTENIHIGLWINNFLDGKTVRNRRSLVFVPGGGRQLSGTRLDRHQWGRIYNFFLRGTF